MIAMSSETQTGTKYALGLAFAAGAGATLCWLYHRWRDQRHTRDSVQSGVLSLIGNTPLIRIDSLSEATGCEILAKAEMLNPGGSVKDRVALQVVTEAMAEGRLRLGGIITEGTAGSTGVSLAMVAAAVGCRCSITMPDDAAIEKVQMIQAYGGAVRRVRPVSIVHPEHPVNVARREAAEVAAGHSGHVTPAAVVASRAASGVSLSTAAAAATEAEAAAAGAPGAPGGVAAVVGRQDGSDGLATAVGGEDAGGKGDPGATQPAAAAAAEGAGQGAGLQRGPGAGGGGGAGAGLAAEGCTSALFADQFENEANYRAHLQTGEEIWRQTRGRVHAFVCGAGTGGTIAGVSRALKAHDPRVRVFLVDPPGSSLFNKVKRGVMYTYEEAEGKRLRNPFDTITEGIGINRLTANFNLALIDDAFRGTDREAVEMASYLLRHDGLWVGSSAAMNCVGAVKAARQLGPGHTVVTVLCDGGHRHLSKFHNPQYLRQHGLEPRHQGRDLSFVA